jgi:hypothetical protein
MSDEKTMDQVVAEISKESDRLTEVRVHEDETKELKTPGFSRMRTAWGGQDREKINDIKNIVDTQILKLLPEPFIVMNDVWELIREKEYNPETGEITVDRYGLPVWKRNDAGSYIEDYSVLTDRQKENFLFRITTGLFEWKQTSADLWGEAMFAKAQWEEALALGFSIPEGRLTVDDRTQKGRLYSQDERYFAIFRTLLSKRADAIVGILELLGQRLKDTLTY